jgi:hypothetical protein
MSSPRTNRTRARLLLVAGVAFAGLLFATARPARAEAVETKSSLSFIPADAAFYASNLRNKEQFDLFLKSNAYKSLEALPLVKMAYGQVLAKLNEGGDKSPLKMFEGFMKDKDNKELVELVLELGADELFLYGGKGFGDLFRVLGDVNNAQSVAPLRALIEGADPTKAQMRGMLLALQNKRMMIRIPELVFGAKLKNPKKAAAQIDRLQKILGGLEKMLPPPLKGKMGRQKVAGGDFLSINVDGSLIPWADINLKEFEDKKDEFEDLFKHLEKMTLSVNLGVKGDYLLFSISSTPKDLEKLDSKQPSLAGADEMKPLAKFADKPLTGISYVSRAFLKAAAGNGTDYTQLAEALKEALQKQDQVKEERKKAIGKDLDALVADFKKLTPDYGARMSFSFMTETGYEGYSYDFTKYTHLGDTKLTLHNHFGGDPIFAAAIAFQVDGSAYKTTIKWAKTIYGHAEAIFLDLAQEEQKEPYEKFTKALFPVLKKIDENTTKKFFPSIKDSGLGIVLDGKWSSKQWFKELPAMPSAMPMAELGLLVGISNAKQFEDALKSYRLLFNELFEAFRGAAPANDNIPEVKIPAPEREKGKNGVLIYYPIPEELGVDKQVQPVAGIGKTVSVLALSKAHAERLMANTPLKVKSKPLAREGNLIGVAVIRWPGLVDVAHPWIDMGVRSALVDLKGPKELDAETVLQQVKVALAVLKTFKSASTATYVEDGKIVSHTEIIIKDLARVVPSTGKKKPKEVEKD